MPGRRPRPSRQPAGRVRQRRQRQRPTAPDDPTRHQLRPTPSRRCARRRRPRPGDRLRLRRSAPEAAVRVRQDPLAQRRHLHRRPRGEGPPRGTERRHGQLHHPATPDPPAPTGLAAVRRDPWRRVLLRPGAAGDELAGGSPDMTDLDRTEDDMVADGSTGTDRWKALDFGPPAPDVDETEPPVLIDYRSGDRVALITLIRFFSDNAITTEMGALLTKVVESIAVRTVVRAVILTGAGDRAFSVGSDLRQRKSMTKEDWLRQRQDFDRTLYTVRQLRKPIFAAVNGIAYGGGSELAQSTDFIIASENATRCSASPPAAAHRPCCHACCHEVEPCRC